MPKKIRIDHWCYNFEWIQHESNYYDKSNDIDLMSCLSMDKEELNYEVEIIKEDKKIEKSNFQYSEIPPYFGLKQAIKSCNNNFEKHQKAINKILDYLMENK